VDCSGGVTETRGARANTAVLADGHTIRREYRD